MQHSLPKNALYVAIVVEPTRFIAGKWRGGQVHSEMCDRDLDDLFERLEGEQVEGVICFDLDKGSPVDFDWQAELDAWREEQSDPYEHSTLNRVGTGCRSR